MNLELATVQSCHERGCMVRLLEQSDAPLSVHYSAAVQDRIRIRRGELVAIDLAPAVPELVWRWRRAEVLKPLRELPTQHHVVAAVASPWKRAWPNLGCSSPPATPFG